MIITQGFGVTVAGGVAVEPQEVDVSTSFLTSLGFDSGRATAMNFESIFIRVFDAKSNRIVE